MGLRAIVVLWREGAWRCELVPGVGDTARLEVYIGGLLRTAEDTLAGEAATHRAEVLRQRVLRGDLSPRP